MYFNIYMSIIQYLQFGYQKGVLYRLKALGERHDMDITIEGFHSWMHRGLSFLLPFLYLGYIFQAYNSWTLYKLSFHSEATWQISFLSLLFLMLFIGNTTTTSMVIPQKLRGQLKERYRLMSLSWAMKVRKRIRVRMSLLGFVFVFYVTESCFSLFGVQGEKEEKKRRSESCSEEVAESRKNN
jgi:hypothetical protein